MIGKKRQDRQNRKHGNWEREGKKKKSSEGAETRASTEYEARDRRPKHSKKFTRGGEVTLGKRGVREKVNYSGWPIPRCKGYTEPNKTL